MAQAATRERQALMPAPRYTKPPAFAGTEAAWRVLCDLYPSAETPEIIMAVVEYCAAKRLDPFKGPVHIVPMYNAKLRRRVQTIMRGINEIEIVATRTGQWAGMDLPIWGPDVERTFRGTVENDDGSTGRIEKTLGYPLWCAVTVHRLVGGATRAFTEQLFWEECYATAGFKSEIPNDRWTKAPRQMLHKCVKAAVLRAAFPEEGLGYAAEEMEDQYTDTGGVTIEGRVDHGDPGLSDRDRKIEQPPPPPPSGVPTAGLALLEEQNASRWIRALEGLLKAAKSKGEIAEIETHPRVITAREKAPSMIRDNITDWINAAHARVDQLEPPPADDQWPDGSPPDDDWPDDPIRELLAEIEAMDQDALDTLAVSTAWKVKTRDLFPPDQDRIAEAIATRRANLKGGKAT